MLDEGIESEWYKVKTGVKQGDVISGFIFLLVVGWIVRRTTENGNTGIRWKFMSKLVDLDFADDIALLSATQQHAQVKVTRLRDGFKTQPPVDRRFRPVPPGFYCSKQ